MSTQTKPNLDALIQAYAKRLLEIIEQVRLGQPNEAQFRQKIDWLLTEFCEKAGSKPDSSKAEYTLATGRADAVFNRLVIEYERPGTLSKNLSDQKTAHAVQQVKDYMRGLAEKDKHKITRLAGVALDGYYIIFVRYHEGRFVVEPAVKVNTRTLERLLRWLASLASGTALTVENLNRDFSIEQSHTQRILKALLDGLNKALDSSSGVYAPMVGNLFNQWRIFFSESIDYSEAFGGQKLKALEKWAAKAHFGISSKEEAERLYFVLHTYFALLVKLLAWLALSRHLAIKLGAPSFATLLAAPSDTLRSELEKMESGGIFRAYGILNLLEGDFFAWYLYAWNSDIESAIRDLLTRLDQYDPTTMSLIPEESRDLFKKLYHYLLPREIRHNLGEYYTPDWLAWHLLTKIDPVFFGEASKSDENTLRKKLLETRFLDPACGSGTFLMLIIARMIELGRALLVSENELLETILNNVVGFDLNPLAVLTARVNYLLLIADLLEHRHGDVTIPVYLADSVRTPAMGEDLLSHDVYEFPTAVGTFQVPAVLCKRDQTQGGKSGNETCQGRAVLCKPGLFDRFCDLLEESLRAGLGEDAFIQRCGREISLPPNGWDDRAISLTRDLYAQMLDLHRRGMNGLWARLLKNNFAPLTVGQFDYIVGNPPWVNWEHLPDQYRQSVAPLWADYELFPHKGFDAILGKSKDDISILMTYVVADKLLREGGRLGFVITQSVFKTIGGGKGFRRFRIPQKDGKEVPLRVVHVDDMVALNPFEGASNRTAVMVLEKGKPTDYPVPYTIWRKTRRGKPLARSRFTYESTLGDVTAATKRLEFQAEPVDPNDPTSPWLTARPKALPALRKILGQSDYEAHAGTYTGGANAVYWVELDKSTKLKPPSGLVMVRNLTEGAKVQVEEVTEPIEPDLLYPLLRGRDVQRWRAEPSALIILTHEPGMRLKAIPEKEMQTRYPRTYGYLKRFEPVLRERAAFKRYFTRKDKNGHTVETGPFYSMFDVGDYTFAPWKVVWPNIASKLDAAVISESEGKIVVPQHIVTLVACESKEEAHYICALINSQCTNLAARAYSQEGGKSFGDPHILGHVRIPRYDPSNPVHQRLAELSQEAHEAAQKDAEERLKEIEAKIDQQAAKLWELTDAELREIQQSLRELEGT